eukprot:TRINITY_DN10448_c0_g2_i2.p1 TRINITY_DN10448_c0_g2~~TRINITY_DN10448_c0_g2_i2.p1  ORF type:complete len:327 (+),score=61.57 TRINITY_DN10448_c0_g2_i2:140-1120(+)
MPVAPPPGFPLLACVLLNIAWVVPALGDAEAPVGAAKNVDPPVLGASASRMRRVGLQADGGVLLQASLGSELPAAAASLASAEVSASGVSLASIVRRQAPGGASSSPAQPIVSGAGAAGGNATATSAPEPSEQSTGTFNCKVPMHADTVWGSLFGARETMCYDGTLSLDDGQECDTACPVFWKVPTPERLWCSCDAKGESCLLLPATQKEVQPPVLVAIVACSANPVRVALTVVVFLGVLAALKTIILPDRSGAADPADTAGAEGVTEADGTLPKPGTGEGEEGAATAEGAPAEGATTEGAAAVGAPAEGAPSGGASAGGGVGLAQ